tara:strand:+ start:2228 stop:3136 length:909 start_codon:yes stop_codon:yes gene_type:complete
MPVLNLAGQAAFRELLGGKLSDYDVREIAKTASERYLEDQVDPNETIRKFAEERQLGPQFITRIAEAANVNIYSEMFKKASPEGRTDIRFPLARGPEITRTLVPPDGPTLQVKEASAADPDLTLDYLGRPPSVLRRSFDPEPVEKVASAPTPHPRYARQYLGKLANMRQTSEGEMLGQMQSVAAAEGAFIKEAKHLLVTDPERLADVYRDACHLGLGKVAAELITRLHEATPSVHVKLGGMVPESYLPGKDTARVVNGESKVLKLLRAVDQRRDDLDDTWRGVGVIDLGREKMIERVRDLSS